MNGLRAAALPFARQISGAAPDCDLLVCPPFTLLATVAEALRGSAVMLGAQDCHPAEAGAHTGDISAEMLADLGCKAVILGHSERRQDHGETDSLIRRKAAAAARAGLLPLVCVGETEAQRDAGQALEVVGRQLAGSLPENFAGVVAYEPVWAIGSGRTPSLGDVEEMHLHIREKLVDMLGEPGRGLRILYGGSVKPENASALLAAREVGGALVGGASLSAASFLAIALQALP